MTDPESTPQEGEKPNPAPEPKDPPKSEPSGFDALPEETKAEIRKLRAEAASNRKEAQEAKAKVEEFEQANASELEKAQGKLTKAEQAKAEAEAKLLRYEVAQEKEVPAKLVPLLTATTKEDLEAQADLILENAKPASPDFDGGAREPAPEPKDASEAHNELVAKIFGLQKQPT